MKNKYYLGIFLAILVLTLNQSFIQYWLYKKNQDSRLINIAGRQRMLSQKLASQYLLYHSGELKKSLLLNSLNDWEHYHLVLLNGDKSLNPVKDVYARSLLKKAYFKIKNFKSEIAKSIPDKNFIIKNQDEFLIIMDKSVNQLVKESDRKLKFIVTIEIVLLLLSIIIIILEVIYIYSPIEKNLKNVINKLSNSENMLSILYESTHDACIFIDNDNIFRYFNSVAEAFYSSLTHKTPIIGQHFNDLIISEEIDFNYYFSKAKLGTKSSFEKKLNNCYWCFTIYPVYDKSNVIVGNAINIQNITEIKENELKAKETEKRLEIITSNFPYGSISLIDKNLHFLYTGGLGYKNYQINPSDLVGLPVKDILSKEIFDEMNKHLPEVWNGIVQTYQVEFSDKVFLNTLQPIFDSNGKTESFVIIVMDVTERVEREEEIKKQNYKLKAIAWQQSHELRRPIANLIGLINLLKEDEEFSNNEYLPLIDKSINDIDKVIEKIMGYT